MAILWDLFVVIAVCGQLMSIPLRVAFEPTPTASGGLPFVIDIFIDILFVAHAFRSGSAGRSTVRVGQLVLSFPVDVILAGILAFSGHRWAVRTAFRFIRLLKLLKLLRLYHVVGVYRRLEHWLVNPTISHVTLPIVICVLAVVAIAHAISCGWFFLAEAVSFARGGSIKSTWVDSDWNDLPELQEHAGVSTGSHFHLYFASLYWAMATLTSVGYGDISAANGYERVFSVAMMLLGTVVTAFMVSTMTAAMRAKNLFNNIAGERLTMVHAYLQHRAVPKDLSNRIVSYYKSYLSCRLNQEQGNSILKGLSSQLGKELTLFFANSVLSNNSFFASSSDQLRAKVYSALRPMCCAKGDFLIVQGSKGRKMYFIQSGLLAAGNHDCSLIYAKLGPGDFVGESALLPATATEAAAERTASVWALEFSSLWSLRKKDLDRLMAKEDAVGQEAQKLRRIMAEKAAQREAERIAARKKGSPTSASAPSSLGDEAKSPSLAAAAAAAVAAAAATAAVREREDTAVREKHRAPADKSKLGRTVARAKAVQRASAKFAQLLAAVPTAHSSAFRRESELSRGASDASEGHAAVATVSKVARRGTRKDVVPDNRLGAAGSEALASSLIQVVTLQPLDVQLRVLQLLEAKLWMAKHEQPHHVTEKREGQEKTQLSTHADEDTVDGEAERRSSPHKMLMSRFLADGMSGPRSGAGDGDEHDDRRRRDRDTRGGRWRRRGSLASVGSIPDLVNDFPVRSVMRGRRSSVSVVSTSADAEGGENEEEMRAARRSSENSADSF